MTSAPSFYESGWLQRVIGPALRPGGTALTDRAVELCGFPGAARLLDVGCGSGATVRHLRETHGFDASGVDISPRLIAEGLLRTPGLPLSEAAAEELPCEDESLDGIFCECVLSLLHEPERAVREFHRTLRPGGYLVISDLYDRRPTGATSGVLTQHDSPLTGSASKENILHLLASGNFSRFPVWEDHTRLLKELAAGIILTHGSLEGFPEICCGAEKPGYYLLVTRKTA